MLFHHVGLPGHSFVLLTVKIEQLSGTTEREVGLHLRLGSTGGKTSGLRAVGRPVKSFSLEDLIQLS